MDHSSPHSQPRILLVKLSSLGDVLHALPTLEALRAAFPQGHLTWLVEESLAPLLSGHPAVNEVWAVPRVRFGGKLSPRDLAVLGGLIRGLRARRFDLVIDLQGLLKSAVWVALARSRRKVGYDHTREWSYLALSERVPPCDPDTHAVRRYLHLAHYLGAPKATPRFRLGLEPAGNLSRLVPTIASGELVVLHPGARWRSKLWPTRSWARLGDWLHRDQGLRVVITGSPGDRGLAEEITANMQGEAVNLAGRTSLAELAAVLNAARLAVTTDTGPMHLAAALGTPVAALFGPTAPWRTGPFGEGHEIVRLGLECSPCFKRHCPEPRCLTGLSPEAAMAACEKILSRSPIT